MAEKKESLAILHGAMDNLGADWAVANAAVHNAAVAGDSKTLDRALAQKVSIEAQYRAAKEAYERARIDTPA